MGLKPREYKETTWREYVLMWRAFNTKRTLEFEQTRVIAFSVLRPYLPKSMTIQKFMPLDIDNISTESMEDRATRLLNKAKAQIEKQKGTNNNIGVNPQKNITHGRRVA